MFGVVLLSASLLLKGNESAYLTRVDNLHNENGLFADRQSNHAIVSTAATGLGVLALAEGVSRGLRDRNQVMMLARSAFHQTVDANPRRNRGWLSHFSDANGLPKSTLEVSTIDTAIFYSGLLEAATLLKDQEFAEQVRHSLHGIISSVCRFRSRLREQTIHSLFTRILSVSSTSRLTKVFCKQRPKNRSCDTDTRVYQVDHDPARGHFDAPAVGLG